jgi:hypothetical protein
MIKDEVRESPVRFLEHLPIGNATEAGRTDPRGSERVSEVYSPSILRIVRQPMSCT